MDQFRILRAPDLSRCRMPDEGELLSGTSSLPSVPRENGNRQDRPAQEKGHTSQETPEGEEGCQKGNEC